MEFSLFQRVGGLIIRLRLEPKFKYPQAFAFFLNIMLPLNHKQLLYLGEMGSY